MRSATALLSSFGLMLLPILLRAAPIVQADDLERSARPTVAISDFPGDDRTMSAFVSETLLTDLGHSDRVQTLERTELRQAMADLDMRDSGPLTPGQVRHLGDLIHATRLVVGSFMVQNDQVVINVRVLDTQSGLNVPGSSFNVTGPRKGLLTVTHRLAQQLYRKLVGEDLNLDEEAIAPLKAPVVREAEFAPIVQDPADALETGKRLGLIPATARAAGPLGERDLGGFLGRLSRHVTPENVVHLAATAGPVSRMQALTAIVKTLVASADMASFTGAGASPITPDGALIPIWGQPYLAAAVDQGWWDASSPLRPREAATWGFLQSIVARLPLQQESAAAVVVRSREEAPAVSGPYTGLVIDARDFDLKRDHSPTIVDEDGHEVYPDPKHCPSPDYVEEHGMAAYATMENDSHRSGARPLVIRAIGVTGPGPFDVVVSNDDARRIAEANRRSKFLWKWNVTMVIAGG